MKPARLFVFVAVVALSAGVAVPALAQGQPPAQPQSGGLFGGNSKGGTPKLSADLFLSLAEAYDSDTPEQLRSVLDPLNPQAGGFYTNMLGSGSFGWQGSRMQVGATGATAFRYFGSLNEIRSISHSGGLGFSASLPKRTTLSLNQSAAYSPSYLYGLFPREADPGPGTSLPIASDYASSNFESYTYSTGLGLKHEFNRRTRVSFTGDYQFTDFLQESDTSRDVRAVSGRGELGRNLSRNLSVNAGYRYRTGDFGYGGAGTSTEHGIDIGLSFSRPLSATRRADFAFKVGGTSVSLTDVPDGVVQIGSQFRQVSADVTAGYQFARTWQVRGTFRRGLEHVAELPEPVTTEGFSAGVEGLFTSRLDFKASVGYSKGQSALTRSALAFDTYMGDTRIRYRLTDNVAAYVQYLYYFYDFSGNTQLTPGLPGTLERNGARAGLTVWVPALRR